MAVCGPLNPVVPLRLPFARCVLVDYGHYRELVKLEEKFRAK